MGSILDGVKFFGAATVGTKGQIVIPAEAREELQIREGDKLVIFSPPDRKGFMTIKAEVLEQTLQDLQSGIGNMLNSTKQRKEK